MHIERFVERNRDSLDIRRHLARNALEGQICPDTADALRGILADIEAAVDEAGNLRVEIAGESVSTRADYERTELARDIVLAEDGIEALIGHICDEDPSISVQSQLVAERLAGRQFEVCFTDRDGTVNGYSNRYVTSIQPAHVALSLTRFAAAVCNHFVVLTAGPLADPGILDLSVMPSSQVVYAASKGREVVFPDGSEKAEFLGPDQRNALRELALAIEKLYGSNRFASFRYVGSGLQSKFGECSVAYQDWQSNCPPELSLAFRAEIEAQIRRIDPDGRTFHVEDGGRDLEISTLDASATAYDKGTGLLFVAEHAGINLKGRSVLVCGDTISDVPMVRRAVEAGARLEVVFVTTDPALQAQLRDVAPQTLFVDRYEALVLGMYLAVTEETHEYMVV